MIWLPAPVDEKVYTEEPLTKASDDVCSVPSTTMVSVPVGVVVVDADADVTLIVIESFAPLAGVVVAAESVVFEFTSVVEDPGHAESKLKKSTEPKPDASS